MFYKASSQPSRSDRALINRPSGAQGIGLKGPTGPAGVPGPVGPQGPTGTQGVAGLQGPTGAQGVAGPQGTTGAQGVAGLQGPTGAQGVAGPQGPIGAQGAAGSRGIAGPQGAAGPQGIIGAQGVTGPQGPTGLQGVPGLQGLAGATGPGFPFNIVSVTNAADQSVDQGFLNGYMVTFPLGLLIQNSQAAQENETTFRINASGIYEINWHLSITSEPSAACCVGFQIYVNAVGLPYTYYGNRIDEDYAGAPISIGNVVYLRLNAEDTVFLAAIRGSGTPGVLSVIQHPYLSIRKMGD